MSMSAKNATMLPKEAYVGDPETGLVHRHAIGCPTIEGVFFLYIQTALVHGYRLCRCCTGTRSTDISKTSDTAFYITS